MKTYVVLLIGILSVYTNGVAFAQCPYTSGYVQKVKQIDISIDATLDVVKHQAVCSQTIKWSNPSNVPIKELRMYMYLNAFQNLNSTFLKGSNGIIFGSDITKRNADEWGKLSIYNCKLRGSSDTLSWRYIQPDDGNADDQSVLSLSLPKPLMPGQTLELSMDFVAKLPKFIARAGYSKDYYAFLHWFPQLGVFEKNKKGEWDWNCHQFFRGTEFFADFANFKVNLIVPQHMVVAASGCKVSETIDKSKQLKSVRFDGRDIIDFAWIAYPGFEEYSDNWQGVEIKMFVPQEHCAMAPRYLNALKNALNFFNDKVAKYPYPTITLIDPPLHGLGSGFMEYPMLITCASFHYVPQGIKTIESLAVHEFSHQFFMAVLASNEKEEAWLDEGFVTFFEDEIADHYFGEKTSIFDIWGYKSGNKERSRLEYTSMDNIHDGPIARPGWEFNEGNFKALIYAKTATILQTLKGLVGEKKFYTIIRNYYEKYKFTHPKEADFIATVKATVGDSIYSMPVDTFFKHTLHGTDYCDYYLNNISSKGFELQNQGKLSLPVEILVTYMDGSKVTFASSGQSTSQFFSNDVAKEIKSIVVDPDHKIYLDINFNNNSYVAQVEHKPSANFGMKVMAWFHFIFQSLSFFV